MRRKPNVDRTLGLSEDDARELGDDAAVRLRTFRLLLVLANELRSLMDRWLADDGLTTQQAALLTVIKALGAPSFSEAAAVLASSHQNVKQIAAALERKGFVRIVPDDVDGRVRRLTTTRKNDRFWASRNPHDHASVLELFADLSPAEAKELFRLLATVRDAVADRRQA